MPSPVKLELWMYSVVTLQIIWCKLHLKSLLQPHQNVIWIVSSRFGFSLHVTLMRNIQKCLTLRLKESESCSVLRDYTVRKHHGKLDTPHMLHNPASPTKHSPEFTPLHDKRGFFCASSSWIQLLVKSHIRHSCVISHVHVQGYESYQK